MSTFNPGGIKIIGPDQYEGDVEKQLEAILKNPAGKLLLEYIDDNPRYIRIVPYTGGGCESVTTADNSRDSVPANVTPYQGYADGQVITRDDQGRMVVSSRDDKANWTGTGQGSDVHVQFTPGIYGASDCSGGTYGSQPDEILFHELVHAYRKMAALFNPVPTVPKLFLYLHEEEWLAILIANIYIAVKNGSNKNLRKDHNGHEELKAPLNTSDGFLKDDDHRMLVRKYMGQQVLFTWELHQVPAAYNPFHEYVLNNRKYNRP
jgi:Effector protein